MQNSSSILVGSPSDTFYDYCPTWVQGILEYDVELLYEDQYITYEWATNEIKQNLLNWVRVGLVAAKVRYYKLWKDKFSSWQEYCEKELGKAKWQISKTIKAARAMIYLAEAGFETLPTCEAQMSKLLKAAPKETDMIESWRKVLEEVPKHLISANAIGRVFGEEPQKKRISVKSDLHERLERKARDLGISVEQLLEGWLEEDEVVEPNSHHESSTEEPSEDGEIMAVQEKMMTRWQADLEAIVKEHDFQNWLTLVWFKFLVPV